MCSMRVWHARVVLEDHISQRKACSGCDIAYNSEAAALKRGVISCPPTWFYFLRMPHFSRPLLTQEIEGSEMFCVCLTRVPLIAVED